MNLKDTAEKYAGFYESPLGKIVIVTTKDALKGIWFVGQKYYPENLDEIEFEKGEPEILLQTKRWLNKYFSGEKPEVKNLNIEPEGGEFRQSVWKILCQIPYGKTMTYGEIADMIAKQRGIERMSAQAVGGAVGHNPISIAIPCHRVLGKDGSLTGYAGEIDKKEKLLELEGISIRD